VSLRNERKKSQKLSDFILEENLTERSVGDSCKDLTSTLPFRDLLMTAVANRAVLDHHLHNETPERPPIVHVSDC